MSEDYGAAPGNKRWSQGDEGEEEADHAYAFSNDEGVYDHDDDDDDDNDDDDTTSQYADGEDPVDMNAPDTQAFKENLQKMRNKLDSEISKREEQQAFVAWCHSLTSPQAARILENFEVHDRNVLYKIATDRTTELCHGWLVKELVEDERSASLLKETYHKHNALFQAILHNKREFIRAVVDSKIDGKILEDAIEYLTYEDENVIHTAISQNFDADLTVKLIEKASKATFGAQNKMGLTPLHMAVEYSKCTRPRLKVVQALIKYGDSAFDQKTTPGKKSVYQYHIESRRKQNKTSRTTINKAKRRGGDVPSGPRKEVKFADNPVNGEPRTNDLGPKYKNKDKVNRDDERLANISMKEISLRRHRPGSTVVSPDHITTATVDVSSRGASQENQAGQDSNAHNTGATDTQANQNNDRAAAVENRSNVGMKRASMNQSGKSVTSSKGPHNSSSQAPDPAIADEIAKELKLHYLRSTFYSKDWTGNRSNVVEVNVIQEPRTHDFAIQFLYGENVDDTQICFDFPAKVRGKTKPISFEDFESSYGGLKFDEVLQYVDFRKFELEKPPPRSRTTPPGTGKQDMMKFFEWLWKKGVRNIIKVSVEDRNDVSHSDKAIEEALKRFKVEILDWRKPDLDPWAIQNACKSSDLRELHLWWTGNNAILRSWSEPDGLVQLRSLTKLYLHEAENGLDSRERTTTNITNFKLRLEENRRILPPQPICDKPQPICVYHIEPEQQSQKRSENNNLPVASQGDTQIDPHRWLTVMDKLAHGIRNLKPPQGSLKEYLTDSKLPERLREDVKVALIDDGVDFMHKPIKEKIQNGKSFDTASNVDPYFAESPDPFHGSTTGHGTLMAYMIGRVCPEVKIFACKLNMIRHFDGKQASFTAKSAAQAVNHAVSRNYDIISMSWTIQKSEDSSNQADLDALLKALEEATRKGIIVFCSAPDIGQSGSETLDAYYPFGCKSISQKIFRIGAANADGSMNTWVGSPDDVDYILPGHEVEIPEDDRVSAEDDIPKTGSSVATALAAGLAALLVLCVRLGAIYNHHRGNGDDKLAVGVHSLQTIKKSAGMKAAFRDIATKFNRGGSNDRNLEVESYFKDLLKALSPGSEASDESVIEEHKWLTLTNVARNLVTAKIPSSVTDNKMKQGYK